MQMINLNEEDLQEQVENTKIILNNLPKTNLYKQNDQVFDLEIKKMNLNLFMTNYFYWIISF